MLMGKVKSNSVEIFFFAVKTFEDTKRMVLLLLYFIKTEEKTSIEYGFMVVNLYIIKSDRNVQDKITLKPSPSTTLS